MPLPAALYYGGLGALRVAPYIARGAMAIGRGGLNAIKGGLKPGNIKNYFTGTKGKFPLRSGAQGPTVTGTAPGIVRPGKYGSNYITQASLGYPAYNYLTGDKGEGLDSVMPPNYNDGDNPEGVSPGAGNTRRGDLKKPKKKTDETLTLKEDIKSGGMDDMIKEKITLFEKYLGKDKDKKQKGAAYEAMVEFGLNLATAKGGNTMDKIARSAKDPLKNFAAVGKEIMNRAEKIKEAGIESGITSYEKAQDRAIDEKGIAMDLQIQELKNEATKKSKPEFIREAVTNIMGNEDILDNFVGSNYYTEGDNKGEKINPNLSDEMIVTEKILNIYGSSNPTEVNSTTEEGLAIFEKLEIGSWYYDVATGCLNQKRG